MTATALKERQYVQDNVQPADNSETRRKRIAREAEAACRDSVDYEEFLFQYGSTGSYFA